MEKTVLDRESCEVEIAGRRFLLQEMSLSDVSRYIRMQQGPVDRAIVEMDAPAAQASDLEAAEGRVTSASDDLAAWLLSRPVDGGPPADSNLLTLITPRMRCRLVEVQDQLNDLEGLPGNALGLLQRHAARRIAYLTATSDGLSASTP